MSKNLDEIDLKILSEIQADGRITNVELAKRVGISPPPCLRRVRTLEEEGYILGYRGPDTDLRRWGFEVGGARRHPFQILGVTLLPKSCGLWRNPA